MANAIKRRILVNSSYAALAIACLPSPQALAATYFVSDATELNNAIAAANASPDASSTIIATQSFTIAGSLPNPSKSLTIDTQGFVLSGITAGSITFNGNFPSGSLTFAGTLTGGASAGSAGVGLVVNSGIATVGGTTAQVINNGSITGGAGNSGGLGVSLTNVVTFINNGAVAGGLGQGGGLGNNGSGVNILNTGATLINNASGVIQGGNSQVAGHVGAGAFLVGSSAKPATLINFGTIRGGSDLSGVGVGAAAVAGRGTNTTITNSGTLEGGNGAAAIAIDSSSWNVSVINSGTIRAGSGSANAIAINTGASTQLRLELQAGSQIFGNVVASPTGLNDVLKLGGTADASFDASTIGATAQYQNFDAFQKIGASAWTLTGASTAVTPWQLLGGVLSIASDASLGATSGAITFDGGTLRTTASFTSARNATINTGGGVFQTDADLTWSGAISGAGALTKTGAGTLVLTGTNTYAGGTTISAGALQLGNGGASGSITGDVINNGALAFNRSDAYTFSGLISGSGTVSQIGSSTTILTANNSYTGGTTISAGTLQLGNGGASGSIAGDVINNGALAFNRLDDITFAGAISGTGGVQKLGAGSLTLTGANSYSGGTTISAGTLIGSATSFGVGQIANNGALIIDQPTNASFANQINGAGPFTKRGAGGLNLTGASGLTGATTVEAGRLSVNGSLSGSAVTVLAGATLGGSGVVGATTVLSGATIAPGNSIGTLTINGAYVQNTGSIYQVEVAPATSSSDLIRVNGSATLASGAGLSVVNYTGASYVAGQRFTILTASGGVTGVYAFDDLALTPFLSLRDIYDANNAYLTVVQTQSIAGVGTTPNQTETGKAVDSLPADNTVHTGMLDQPTLDRARLALQQLSGEIHSSAKTAAIETSHFVRNAAIDRMRDAFCGVAAPKLQRPAEEQCDAGRADFTMWGQAFGSWGRTKGDGNASTLSRSTGGFFVGADASVFAGWRAGLLAGYSRNEFSVKSLGSSGHSDDYHLGVYGGAQWGPLGLRIGASHTWREIGTSQSFSQILANGLTADYRARVTQLFGDLGYRFDFAGVALEPYATLAYLNLDTSGFTQRGGDAALIVRGDATQATFSTLGLRAASQFAFSGIEAQLKGALGWRHLYGDDAPTSVMSFAAGSTPFTIAGAPITRDAAVVEAGLEVKLAPGAVFSVSYGGQFGDNAADQTVRGHLRVTF
ncbi:autotransporter domain-containing protein [Terrarubrum flagellatum]|uniref:autotransporter domain-containing protein n=1 Tax=Terrirubrum flagellatum TaxID=2895980 RepID=UPI003144F266